MIMIQEEMDVKFFKDVLSYEEKEGFEDGRG
jgi:hypothetical protein